MKKILFLVLSLFWGFTLVEASENVYFEDIDLCNYAHNYISESIKNPIVNNCDLNKSLEFNSSEDLTKLTDFYIDSDYSSLVGLEKFVNITEIEYLLNYEFSEIDFNQLKNLTNIEKISISGFDVEYDKVNIMNLDKILHLNLQYFEISYLKLDDLQTLSNFVNLEELRLEGIAINDISFLNNLTNLKRLDLNSNEITDITLLSNFINLEELNLSHNNIIDITPISNLVNLTLLDVRHNNINNIESLKNLINLKSIYISNNGLTDIRVLNDLTNLTHVYADDCILSISENQKLNVYDMTKCQLLDIFVEDVTQEPSIDNEVNIFALMIPIVAVIIISSIVIIIMLKSKKNKTIEN